VNRGDVQELHYITSIDNLPSILAIGIVSHNRAQAVAGHASVADPAVQERRRAVRVPAGRPLHDFANLYFNARNPMLYVVCARGRHERVCVLRVSTTAMDLPDVVVADRNASSRYARFSPAAAALERMDGAMIYTQSWNHADPAEKDRRTSLICAEVLVPDVLPASYILGAYVSCPEGRTACARVAPTLPVTVSPNFFFR
jgi:hypothetical protein